MGLSLADIRLENGPRGETRRLFAEGKIDALVHSGVVPLRLPADAEVIPITGPAVDQLLRAYPFVVRTVLPAGTYPSMRGPIPTVGVQVLLICRADLDEHVVHDFTQEFFDSLPELSSSLEALRTMRLDESPSTPIPLHPGAARFYRERELRR
jgi:TRAP transporter TAXI family solute receptor